MKNRPTHKKHNCVKSNRHWQCTPVQAGGYITTVQSVAESTCSTQRQTSTGMHHMAAELQAVDQRHP